MFLITWGSGKKNSLAGISKSIFLFPPMIMFFLTIFAKNFEIPKFLILTSQNLGSTLVPIAMIAIGMKLELKHIFAKLHIVSVAVVLKMIIVPVIVLFAFKYCVGDGYGIRSRKSDDSDCTLTLRRGRCNNSIC